MDQELDRLSSLCVRRPYIQQLGELTNGVCLPGVCVVTVDSAVGSCIIIQRSCDFVVLQISP